MADPPCGAGADPADPEAAELEPGASVALEPAAELPPPSLPGASVSTHSSSSDADDATASLEELAPLLLFDEADVELLDVDEDEAGLQSELDADWLLLDVLEDAVEAVVELLALPASGRGLRGRHRFTGGLPPELLLLPALLPDADDEADAEEADELELLTAELPLAAIPPSRPLAPSAL